MLNKIKIANVASYDAIGIDITNLKKVNFFYGGNGCGKTTISNYLANPSHAQYQACSVEWKGNRSLKALVYNKQFRDENFGAGKIAGIFTLGKATKEELEHIQSKKQNLSELRELQFTQNQTITNQMQLLQDHIDIFTEDCWAVYKKYEQDFKEALRGSIKAKITFRDKILLENVPNIEVPSLDALKRKASTLLESKPEKLNLINILSPSVFREVEQNDIWKKVVVGKFDVDIAGLITKLGNSDWVSQGMAYMGEDGICPFCQKATLDEKFHRQIEEYFDEGFERDKALITTLQKRYLQEFINIKNVLGQIELSEKLNPKTKLNIDEFSAHFVAIQSQISENMHQIQLKFEKTSQQVGLINTENELDRIEVLIRGANQDIHQHNQLVINYDQELTELKNSIWKFLVKELTGKINAYQSKKNGLQKGIDAISTQVSARSEEIKILENDLIVLGKNITSIQPTVDEINRMLESYGFTGFKIIASTQFDNHYSIQRENGDLAHHTLSEGEVTFITFLYFVQLAKGSIDQNSVSEDRVLVIDDPISSLDSNVLYVVSTIVKDIIKAIKNGSGSVQQVLLLTHNVYFHKEASFQGARSNGDHEVHFWILRKNKNITSIQPFGLDNPIESSYELLWREIKEWQRNSGITLQNTMRRIIENYFKILGRYGDDDLVAKFTSHEEQQICRSLVSWINDGSHTVPDDLYVQNPGDSAEKYLGVFKKVFEHTNNEGHYKMMMRE